LGQAIAKVVLNNDIKAIRIFSNDENQQVAMERDFANDARLRFFIGDVRDRGRLRRAMHKVDAVIHAAALKHVPICEYNPIEAIKTNIDGSINVIDTAIDTHIPKVLAISSDKAVHPINIYGASKLVMEKLFTQANVYGDTKLSCIRFPNFWGSRGSIVPLIEEQAKQGKVTITHKEMTRFWITLEKAAEFTLKCLELMKGGEIFIPKASEELIADIISKLAPEAKLKVVGKRRGEKLHERLFAESEHPLDMGDYFIVR